MGALQSLKKKKNKQKSSVQVGKISMGAHAYNPSTRKTKAEYYSKFKASLSNIEKPCFNRQNEELGGLVQQCKCVLGKPKGHEFNPWYQKNQNKTTYGWGFSSVA